MDSISINVVFNVDSNGFITNLLSMSDISCDEQISLQDLWQANLKCTGCSEKFLFNFAFKFPYNQEANAGTKLKIVHVESPPKPEIVKENDETKFEYTMEEYLENAEETNIMWDPPEPYSDEDQENKSLVTQIRTSVTGSRNLDRFDEDNRPWWAPVFETPKSKKRHCYVCKQPYETEGSQAKWKHFRMHHPKMMGKLCDICGEHRSKDSMILLHRETHFPSKGPVTCDKCQRSWPYKYNMAMHNCRTKGSVKAVVSKKKQTLRQWFICDFCGSKLTTKGNLLVHLKTLHMKSGPVYQCEQCPYKSRRQINLRRHMRFHHRRDQLSIVCFVCDKRFAEQNALKLHMRCHSDEKAYVCEECGKAYKHKDDLAVHRFVHTGEMPFECRFCSKRFNDRGNKNAHQRRVHGEELKEYKAAKYDVV